MKERHIRISVVIPAYNSSHFIERALDSVLQQTRKPYEIIVVDDGSRDCTLQRVQGYAQKKRDVFARFKIFSQRNQGPGAARNVGIRHADGNWISFLDSDDIWKPEKLEYVMRIIDSQPDISIVSHEMYYMNENEVHSLDCAKQAQISRMHQCFHKGQPLFVQLYRANFLATSCLTVKKELLVMARGFHKHIQYAEDYDLWLRIAGFGRLYMMECPLSYYISRKENLSSDIFQKYFWEMKVCKKYIPVLYEYTVAVQVKRIVRNRVIRIHLANMKAACKNRKLYDGIKIGVRLPFQLCRMKGYL